jgi:hypothetical protein
LLTSSITSALAVQAVPPKRSKKKVDTFYGITIPRIYTPPLRPLTPETTLGFEAIEFAEDILGLTLTPWQEWFLKAVLELREDGTFRFRTVLMLIARQNGKTTVMEVLILWQLYVNEAELVIGTAQKLDVAEKTLLQTYGLAKKTPELAEHIPSRGGIVKKNGSFAMNLRSGASYVAQACNEDGGRSMTANMTFVDELRSQKNYDGWDAITATTVSVRSGIDIAVSNAGTNASVVLNDIRKKAHGRPVMTPNGLMVDPDKLYKKDEALPEYDDSLGIFEWSAEPSAEVTDPYAIRQANPSLEYTSLTMRSLLSKAANLKEGSYRTEHLCQKVEAIFVSPFADGVWEAGVDKNSGISEKGRFVFCIEVARDRSSASIGVAGYREDGNIHIEIVAQRTGTYWVKKWIEKRQDDPNLIGVALQSKGAPVSSFMSNGEFDDLTCDIIEWTGPELTRGTSTFFDLVKKTYLSRVEGVNMDDPEDETAGRLLFHLDGQPALDLAVQNAAKRNLGDAFQWDRQKSPIDIAPLNAVTGAVWALLSVKEKKTVYDDSYFTDKDLAEMEEVEDED